MKKFIAILGVSMAAVNLFAAEQVPAPASVDFTSSPEGVNVIVDGKLRGITPLRLTDLKVDERHHLRFEKNNYCPYDEFFLLDAGARIVRHAELEVEHGLLLLTSEPSGCDIMLDGLSLGVTPRLITSLESRNTYRLALLKAGYQTRELEVKFNGRAPLVRHEKLILDSGVLVLDSDPSGAEVMVNGIARGATPVTVNGIAKGHASVTIKKPGYLSVTRELALNAGDTQNLFVTLEGIPGTMSLTSVPEGARFYVNGEMRGKSPLILNNLKPGSYTVRAEKENFSTVVKQLKVDFGASIREEFKLDNMLGRLELNGPAGAKVFWDGRQVGEIKENGPDSKIGEVFTINGIKQGEHTLTLRKYGHAEVVRHVKIEPSKTTIETVDAMRRVFTPNVVIVTESGRIPGVLISNTPEMITMEVALGLERTFPRSIIRKIEFLSTPGLEQ